MSRITDAHTALDAVDILAQPDSGIPPELANPVALILAKYLHAGQPAEWEEACMGLAHAVLQRKAAAL